MKQNIPHKALLEIMSGWRFFSYVGTCPPGFQENYSGLATKPFKESITFKPPKKVI